MQPTTDMHLAVVTGGLLPTAVYSPKCAQIYTKENQAMTTEENAECYIDLFDMMLVVNSPHNSYTKNGSVVSAHLF